MCLFPFVAGAYPANQGVTGAAVRGAVLCWQRRNEQKSGLMR
jgi:hypothetical protein